MAIEIDGEPSKTRAAYPLIPVVHNDAAHLGARIRLRHFRPREAVEPLVEGIQAVCLPREARKVNERLPRRPPRETTRPTTLEEIVPTFVEFEVAVPRLTPAVR